MILRTGQYILNFSLLAVDIFDFTKSAILPIFSVPRSFYWGGVEWVGVYDQNFSKNIAFHGGGEGASPLAP